MGGIAGWSRTRSRVYGMKSNRTVRSFWIDKGSRADWPLAEGREGKRVVFIAGKRTGRVFGILGCLTRPEYP